ncbi:MAG: 2-polyprenyl-3-methyl-6-methoxy-1,4-benzoquinone monooxygenase [Pseudomonadota bacterium]
MNLIDTLIIQLDQALHTLVPGSIEATRRNPADANEQAPLESVASKHAAGLMRINHTGEVCAQALYQGQALTAKLPDVRSSMEQAAKEESDHLQWCESRLTELDSRPSLLNPLWYGMSFGLGALAGLAGDKWSLGFVAETEQQVCKHLQEHLAKLPEEDQKSRSILLQMLSDESQHAASAIDAGAAPLPAPVKQVMGLMAKVMKTAVYRI